MWNIIYLKKYPKNELSKHFFFMFSGLSEFSFYFIFRFYTRTKPEIFLIRFDMGFYKKYIYSTLPTPIRSENIRSLNGS